MARRVSLRTAVTLREHRVEDGRDKRERHEGRSRKITIEEPLRADAGGEGSGDEKCDRERGGDTDGQRRIGLFTMDRMNTGAVSNCSKFLNPTLIELKKVTETRVVLVFRQEEELYR